MLLVAWFAVLAVILYAGLRFDLRNGVKWLGSRHGLSFERRGLAYTDQRFYELLRRDGGQPNSCTIELVVVPHQTSTDHVAQILSDDDTGRAPNILLAQWRSILVIRAKFGVAGRPASNGEVGVDDVFRRGEPVHIVVTSALGETHVYINGRPAVAGAYNLDVPHLTGHLLLGNSGTGEDPWLGDFLLVALDDRAISQNEAQQDFRDWQTERIAVRPSTTAMYLFSDNVGNQVHNEVRRGPPLKVPWYLTTLHRERLVWNLRTDKAGLFDIVLNVLGFIPYGFLTAACLRQYRRWLLTRICMIAFSSGVILSFGIELLQAYMPGRDSSATDLLMNGIGTAIGVLVAFLARPLVRSARPANLLS